MSPFGTVPKLIPRNEVQLRLLVAAAVAIDDGAAKFVLEFVLTVVVTPFTVVASDAPVMSYVRQTAVPGATLVSCCRGLAMSVNMLPPHPPYPASY